MGPIIKNIKGQSVVEYVFLLSVIIFFISIVFNSDIFKQILGDESQLFVRFKNYTEYSYRHTHVLLNATDEQILGNYGNYSGNHESYTQGNGQDTRFFLVQNPYGGN